MTVFFDLDGTLIDSAPSIIKALEQACRDCGLTPARPITADLLGPPLSHIAAQLAASGDTAARECFIQAFTALYDIRFCTQTAPFPGMEALLRHVCEKHAVFLVTNKRLAPTERIIAHLGWKSCFAGIYSPDSIRPAAASKASLLAHVLSTRRIDPGGCVYVGDTQADQEAAEANAMPCLLMRHGYGPHEPGVPNFTVNQLQHALEARHAN